MKKTNKIFAATLSLALMLPMLTVSAFAAGASETGTTNVQYDNTHGIPDPDHPDNPSWAVTIPSSVVFTDSNPVINVDVELVSVNGGTLPTSSITVEVTSANGYKLEVGGADPVSYVVQYGSNIMSTAMVSVGTVSSATTTISGTATLTGTATQTGSHTDTLTYTITN